MIHELLGKRVEVKGLPYRVTMLRADCDHGIAQGWTSKQPGYYLVRLSDQAVIREIRFAEDFDKVIIEAGRDAAVPA